ncbi:MAG TPA: aminoglycoside phosphotransferase family protein [Clostridia bacterium]|nr:aminoglycoside phosphotransferase family protein [Clostridia bacterium]
MLDKLIGTGYFSDVYNYGEGKAIKLMKAFVSYEDTIKEYEILKAVHEHYPYTPAVYGIETIGARHGIVMDKAPGLPISDLLIRYGGITMKRDIKMLADYQARLHSIQDETLIPYIELFNKCLKKVELPISQKEFIQEYVNTLAHKSFMCHGDFHTDNMVIGKGRVTIVDWSSAYRGNPLSDAVNMQIIMRMPIEHHKLRFPVNVFAGISKRLILKIYYKEYCKLTGASMADINSWLLPAAVIRLGEGVPNECIASLFDMIELECNRLGYSKKAEAVKEVIQCPL